MTQQSLSVAMTRATQASWYPTPSLVQQLHLIRAALQWTLLMFHVVAAGKSLLPCWRSNIFASSPCGQFPVTAAVHSALVAKHG
jgi:hypothetical protein